MLFNGYIRFPDQGSIVRAHDLDCRFNKGFLKLRSLCCLKPFVAELVFRII